MAPSRCIVDLPEVAASLANAFVRRCRSKAQDALSGFFSVHVRLSVWSSTVET